jgi:amino-acid N-acetyltransferase
MKYSITQAQTDQLGKIITLLERNQLPTAGLEEPRVVALVAWDGEDVIGSVALEIYDKSALLRSVAVDESYRGQGMGQELTQAALDLARSRNICRVYLLTETADNFFPRFGFTTITRDEVDEQVRESVEFKSACPASAHVMALSLDVV